MTVAVGRARARRKAGEAARWAVVTVAALDLRRRPNHRAELGSQLLAGELARRERTSPDALWWRVRGPDGYPGWARAWGLAALTESEAARWRRRATARVRVPYTLVRARPGRGPVLSPAYLHARFAPLERRGAWQGVELPGGGRGWIERAHLSLDRRRRRPLAERVRQLLGVPYLWGGRTTMGLDCSGFVQMVLLEDGVELPRDAHEQWLATRKVPRGTAPRRGDLVFFGRPRGRMGHVGVLLDPATYAHARGSVRVNSLLASNKRYDNELAGTVRGFGRPRRAPRRRPT